MRIFEGSFKGWGTCQVSYGASGKARHHNMKAAVYRHHAPDPGLGDVAVVVHNLTASHQNGAVSLDCGKAVLRALATSSPVA